MKHLWEELGERGGVRVDEGMRARLGRYLELLEEANRGMNLTRIVGREAAEVGHVGDALTLLRFLPGVAVGREGEGFTPAAPGPVGERMPAAPAPLAHGRGSYGRGSGRMRIVDVGSGGGVPGVVLAIVRPDAEVVLVEATRKKAAFLQRVVEELGLGNVSVVAARAEEVGQAEATKRRSDKATKGGEGGMREGFDVAVTRAVGALVWVAEWCLPLVRVGGKVLAMKGPKAREELEAARRAIRMLGGGEAAAHPAELPGAEGHVIVEIPKVSRTDERYPRAASAAKGRPLG